MRISSATEPPAASTAFDEAEVWAALADRWQQANYEDVWADLPPIEGEVIRETDPTDDLMRRARRWSYAMERRDLGDLALFAAALARTEGEAWERENRSLATQAFADRRFLAADRIVPWAVPWLTAVGRCFPHHRESAEWSGEALLDLGEQHRFGPSLAGSEGLVPPGHDGYGPASEPADLQRRLGTLWGGMVVFGRSLRSVTGMQEPDIAGWLNTEEGRGSVVAWYEVAAARWRGLADRYSGTAQYWLDLTGRATRTMERAAIE